MDMRRPQLLILAFLLMPLTLRAADVVSSEKPGSDVASPRSVDGKKRKTRKRSSKKSRQAPAPKPQTSAPHPVTHDWLNGQIATERERLSGSLQLWQKQRARKIAIVPTIGKLDLTQGMKFNLSNRYKLLLSKQRSNRQWSAYWEGEARLSKQISEHFRTLIGNGNLLIDVHEDVLSYLHRTTVQQLLEIRMARHGSVGQLQQLTNRLTELTKQQRDEALALVTLTKTVTAAEAKLKAANEALAQAKTSGDKTAEQSAATATKKAEEELTAAKATLVKNKAAHTASQALVNQVTLLHLALQRKPFEDSSSRFKTALEKLATASAALSREWASLLKGAEKVLERHGELARVRGLVEDGVLQEEHEAGNAYALSHKELARTRLALEKATTTYHSALQEVRAVLDDEKKALEAQRRTYAALTIKLGETRKQIKDNDAQLAKAQKDKDKAAERQALKASRRLKTLLARETAQEKSLAEEIADAESTQSQLTHYWSVLQLSPGNGGDAIFDSALQAWATTRKTIEDTRDRVRDGADRFLEEHRKRIEVSIWTRRLTERQHVLGAWQTLALAKQENQRLYLRAINTNISAVEERLRRLDERTTGKKSPSKKSEEEDFEEGTPYRTWKRNLQRLKNLRARRYHRLREEEENLRLLKGRMDSARQLKSAQTTDVNLLRQEVATSQKEAQRSASSRLEEANWRNAWKHYHSAALAKQGTLRADLTATDQLSDELKNENRLLDLAITAHKDAITDLKKQIGRAESRGVTVWLTTIWQWIKRNIWDIPVALILMLLTLRVVTFVDRRVMIRAEAKRAEDRAAVQQVQTLSSIVTGVIKVVVIGGFSLWLLSKVGINVGPLLGGAAILGLAISFGSQNLVRDVVTGFFILLEKQYTVGDFIEIGAVWGEVELLTLRRTVVRSRDGKAHIFANGEIKNLSNLTMGWSRALLHIGVSYSSNLTQVKEVVNAVGQELWNEPTWRKKLIEPPAYVGLSQMADSALVVRVMGKTKPFHHWDVELELNHRLKEAFDANGIVIPFPQRDVHMYHYQQKAVGTDDVADKPKVAND